MMELERRVKNSKVVPDGDKWSFHAGTTGTPEQPKLTQKRN
jgi:hypothetical protein